MLVPQFVARPAYLDRLAVLASQCRSAYVELVLLADLEVAERRFRARRGGPVIEDYAAEYARLVAVVEGRPVQQIPSTDPDATYRQLLVALA